jgi:hypothetical protein
MAAFLIYVQQTLLIASQQTTWEDDLEEDQRRLPLSYGEVLVRTADDARTQAAWLEEQVSLLESVRDPPEDTPLTLEALALLGQHHTGARLGPR